MTEEIPVEVQNEFLDYVKKSNLERLVSHLSGVGSEILNAYPVPEIHSWTIQKFEAEALLAYINTAETVEFSVATSKASFINQVCEVHYGPADDETRLIQLTSKAQEVLVNANTWASVSAFVNGLRARVAEQILSATTEGECHAALHNGFNDLAHFRNTYGL